MTQVDLDQTGRALIELTRDAYEPSAANRAQVRWRVEHRLASDSVPAGYARGHRVSKIAIWSVAALAVAGAAAALAWQGGRGEPAAQPRSVTPTKAQPGSAAPKAARRAPLAARVESPEPAAPPSASATAASAAAPSRIGRATVRPSPTRPSDADLADEVALIARAQAATNRGQAEQALVALQEYDRKHPGGELAEERSAARILALCAAGKPQQAQAEAVRFRANWPNSPQAARIQSSCAGR